jgi:hypothetical protein
MQSVNTTVTWMSVPQTPGRTRPGHMEEDGPSPYFESEMTTIAVGVDARAPAITHSNNLICSVNVLYQVHISTKLQTMLLRNLVEWLNTAVEVGLPMK